MDVVVCQLKIILVGMRLVKKIMKKKIESEKRQIEKS